MTDETHAEPAPEPAPASPASGAPRLTRARIVMLGVVAASALAGVGSGAVVGPRLAKKKAAAPASTSEPPHAAEPAGDGVFYQLENVVVNPAGSEGLRFLMVTVALELRDAKALTRMGEQEVRVRDAVVAVLERQSLEMLTGPGARDSLRSRLMAAVAPLADGALLRVYLPQFVIQ